MDANNNAPIEFGSCRAFLPPPTVPPLTPSLETCRALAAAGWTADTAFETLDPDTGAWLKAPTAEELHVALPDFEMAWKVGSHYATNRQKGRFGYSSAAEALAYSWIELNGPQA